jgi:bleomycin hydrolase
VIQTQPRTRPVDGDPAGALDTATLDQLAAAFDRPAYRLAQNAVARTNVDDLLLDQRVIRNTDHTFSVQLDDWSVTNQKQSGRCWMFAGLNLLRVGARKAMGLKEFEFSQNYVMFWDKVERANYFFEAIIEGADRDVDDRSIAFLLDGPLSDGGQWNMFVNLVKKHGLVPKAFMPETESSSSSRKMNSVLRTKLREGAKRLRDMAASGASVGALRSVKLEYMEAAHRILSIHLGTPPQRFTWQWRDSDSQFHRTEELTPLEFTRKFVELPLDEYVCLVHDPRPTSPFGRTFTVQYLGNVVGGDRVIYLNVDIDLIKSLAQQTLEAGEPVWFGCDTGKQMRRDMGLWDLELFNYAAMYDTSFALDKAARLQYGESAMNHAMLFTGVDVVDGKPRRWRVENSWGNEPGQKGFFTMNDPWFNEYLFEIAARRSSLPAELQSALDQEPIVLPAWDPMGALA